MNFDFHLLQLIIIIVVNIVLVTGAYWKLKNDINERPQYQKVEEMIKRDTIKERRVEEIVNRDSFPKGDGQVLLSKMEGLEKALNIISEKLDSYFKPRKDIS